MEWSPRARLTWPAPNALRLVFLHRVRYPFFPRYDNLAYYGIARGYYGYGPSLTLPAYKGRNLHLNTPDGEVIGAWHIL